MSVQKPGIIPGHGNATCSGKQDHASNRATTLGVTAGMEMPRMG